MNAAERIVVLIANPSPDVYGSDLQMLESVTAMVERGQRVVVALPEDGVLGDLLRERGAEVRLVDFPVLRRANASPREFGRMAAAGARAVLTIRTAIRQVSPSLVYVNTQTLPWWLLAARLCGVPVVCHVHEAETKDRTLVRMALNAPLILATAIIVISQSSLSAMCDVAPYLRKRAHLIYNGVAEPPTEPRPVDFAHRPIRLAVIGRLSPRKAPDLALEAVARLRNNHRDVSLEVCGTPFRGYEWFSDQLRRRAEQPDLLGAVTWPGYVSPIWPVLERADIVLAPSLREPFGNAVVEAQLAARPVVATAALGHLETIEDGSTGLLVPEGNIDGFVTAVETLIDDPAFAARLAEQGRATALRRFSLSRYRAEVGDLIESLADRRS